MTIQSVKIKEVKTNIFNIEVPLPKNPLKATNAYLLKGKSKNLLIDTGMNRQECKDALNTAIDSLDVDMEKTDLFVTHLHADHLGLAFYFAGKNSKIYFNQPDTKVVNDYNFWERAEKMALQSGFPQKEVNTARKKHPGYKYSQEESDGFTFVQENDTLEVGNYKLKCISTPGHTPGNTCLYDKDNRLFFSGDHVLWDITPNISAFLEKGNNPLGKYLESLDKVSELDVELVLPGHRNTFTDLYGRVEQLKNHHFERIEEIKTILKEKGNKSAYQVASHMTWDIDCNSWTDFPLVQKWFATGEALAHLEYMEKNNMISKETEDSNDISIEFYYI